MAENVTEYTVQKGSIIWERQNIKFKQIRKMLDYLKNCIRQPATMGN